VCANAELKDGGGGVVVFSPRRNYIGMRERGEISSGEGKWIPISRWKLAFIGGESTAGTGNREILLTKE
jgi:hypothetical protein